LKGEQFLSESIWNCEVEAPKLAAAAQDRINTLNNTLTILCLDQERIKYGIEYFNKRNPALSPNQQTHYEDLKLDLEAINYNIGLYQETITDLQNTLDNYHKQRDQITDLKNVLLQLAERYNITKLTRSNPQDIYKLLRYTYAYKGEEKQTHSLIQKLDKITERFISIDKDLNKTLDSLNHLIDVSDKVWQISDHHKDQLIQKYDASIRHRLKTLKLVDLETKDSYYENLVPENLPDKFSKKEKDNIYRLLRLMKMRNKLLPLEGSILKIFDKLRKHPDLFDKGMPPDDYVHPATKLLQEYNNKTYAVHKPTSTPQTANPNCDDQKLLT